MSAPNINYTSQTIRSNMSPTRNGQYFKNKLSRLAAAASDLAERVEVDGATERDLAIAVELNQQYVDALDEMLDGELELEQ